MNTNHSKILFYSILFYCLGIGFLQIMKYTNFLYNGLDLAIFSNFFYNFTYHFSSFSSIQGHTYLGDHITPFGLILIPLFTAFTHPLTLLFAQTIALGTTSVIIYHLVKTFFIAKKTTLAAEKWALGASVAWLFNPLLINAALFEFHMIVFALPLIFGAFYFYIQKKFTPFILLLILACLVREDVSLVVASFGVIAWIERAPWRFRLTPLFFGLGYFIAALWVLSQSHETFRFFIYYSWLGDTIPEILITLFTRPHIWLPHILSLPLFDMLVGLFFPFALLPLLRPKYLLLAALPFVQFVFGSSGGSSIIVMSHYAVLFIPALVLATLEAISTLSKNKNNILCRMVSFEPQLSIGIAGVFILLVSIFFSTLHTLPQAYTNIQQNHKKTALAHAIIQTIPINATIASTYSALPNLSTRQDIYSLHYVLLGNQQFSTQPYILEPKPSYVYFDMDDILLYDLQTQSYKNSAKLFHTGIHRIQTLLKNYTPTWHAKNISTWQRAEKEYTFETKLFPQTTTTLTCNQITHGLGLTYHCSVLEPNNAVYTLRLHFQDGTTAYTPFIWREYTNTASHPAYARFVSNTDMPISKIDIVSRTGFVVLGDLLHIDSFETEVQTIQTIYPN